MSGWATIRPELKEQTILGSVSALACSRHLSFHCPEVSKHNVTYRDDFALCLDEWWAGPSDFFHTAELWWDALECGIADTLPGDRLASRLCQLLETRFAL